ncbi:MAG: right-handed parallel beta-helix repeat-containing protein, partial [Sedimentisphaerales bacterium]|nr:right-handed parallel beta-helix repeat-containing protein [Sedimentisphaerales bacterium]
GVTTDDYDVLIGENQERTGRYWDGMIDDVRIYNYALSAAEVAQLVSPTVIYVDSDAPGANNGCCWADAFHCLQDALALAAEGAEIRVAQGTYTPDCGEGITPGDRTATFALKNAVIIQGGYAGYGEAEPDARSIGEYLTVLSGDLIGNDTEVSELENWEDNEARSDNSYHVVTAMHTGSTAVLDGFTVSGGYTDATSPIFYGAGMYIYQGNPTVTNCVFTDNWALNYGAGMCIDAGSTPIVTDCTFTANASTDGAGADNEESSPTFIRCAFTANIVYEYNADSYGGAGMYNYRSNPILTNCIFAGNTAPGWGTCAGLQNDRSSPILLNCTFHANHTEDGWSGGIYNDYESFPELTNCILWGNTNEETHDEFAQIAGYPATVNYCCIQGWTGDLGGIGNIAADPCFVSPWYWEEDDSWVDGDYHLKSFGWRWDVARRQWVFDRVTSRCIDAGNPGSPLLDEPLTVPDDPDNDYGQNLRINMGAYGGTAQASMPPYDWVLLGDINNDGIVDFFDVACAAPYWGLTTQEQPFDLDRNGTVAPPDLDLFADDWLNNTLWWE